MQQLKRFEILDGLPTYGPMYVSVSADGQAFYSEGFVVRFYSNNGNSWVANFLPGWTDFSLVIDFPANNRIIVIAKGSGYIMQPEEERSIKTFGVKIKEAYPTKVGSLVLTDDDTIYVLDDQGEIWQSERISWDGIKDINIEGDSLSGLSYDPMDSTNEWVPFSIDLDTKKITGGSYRRYSIE